MQTGTEIKVRIIVEEKATKYKPHTTIQLDFPMNANGEPYDRPQYVFQQLIFWFLNAYWEKGFTQLDAVMTTLKYDRLEAVNLLKKQFVEVSKNESGNGTSIKAD